MPPTTGGQLTGIFNFQCELSWGHLPGIGGQLLQELGVSLGRNTHSREHGVSKATIYNWKAKYGGMEMNELKKYKELEEENRKLKQMYGVAPNFMKPFLLDH